MSQPINSNSGNTLVPPHNPQPTTSFCGRLWRVYADAMDESSPLMKGIFKLVGVASFWMKYFNPNTPKAYSEVANLTKNFKNFTSCCEWPIRIEKLKKSITSFDMQSPVRSTANIGSEICSVINNGSDTAEFVNAVQPLPTQVMEKVKVANFAATFLGSLKGSFDSMQKVISNCNSLQAPVPDHVSAQAVAQKKNKTYSQLTSNMMGLVAKVCYAALGALGLISLSIPVAPVAMVSLLTVGTVVGLANLFFDRIVDPNDDRAKKMAQNPLFDSAMNYKKAC